MEKNVLNTDLTGKVAVVTGASGTLCSIFAKALARAGAKVALLGRNMDKLKELDEVAYVRFASVYRQFKDITTFRDELNKLLDK